MRRSVVCKISDSGDMEDSMTLSLYQVFNNRQGDKNSCLCGDGKLERNFGPLVVSFDWCTKVTSQIEFHPKGLKVREYRLLLHKIDSKLLGE